MSFIVIPQETDPCVLRYINIEGYKLLLWDCFRERSGRSILGYAFIDKGDVVLFVGEDLYCSPNNSIDSDKTIKCLLGFLTLHPGDTDAEYFKYYTEAQLAFANSSDCVSLSLYADDECTTPFKDLL